MSGQTLHDRLTAARHTLAGQGLARIVCKATTEEVIGPKKKHLDYLIQCTNEPNVSIPQLANLLIERTQQTSWVIVFKALTTVHHLMCYGNERFTQYLASSNCTFQLSNFLDKSTVQAAYDMSTFIRRYAKYLNEKALSYRTTAFDFCKVKRGKDDGTLRTMNTDKLLKTLPALQSQLDALLEFDCTSNDLTNGVVNSCFMLLFRDLIRLFACYNDGIINLLEKYFDMNKKNCREALDIYKKFLIRMDRVAEFLKVAENVGIDKGDIPDLTKAPGSLLDALEQHLATLEGKKGATAASTAARSTNLRNAVSALSSTSNAFGSAANGNGSEVNGMPTDESALKALEEEATIMNQLKLDGDVTPNIWEQPKWDDVERRVKEIQSQQSTESMTKTNPFLVSPEPPEGGGNIVDLFSQPLGTSSTMAGETEKASNDLLCLSGNPFADSLFGAAPPQQQHQQQQPQQAPQSTSFVDMFGSNDFTGPPAAGFASEASFAAAFGQAESSSPRFDAFGDVLQPTTLSGKAVNGTDAKSGANKLLKGDLDSSLASLAQNLDINGPKQAFKKPGGRQWGSPKVNAKPNVGVGATWGAAPPNPSAAPAPGVPNAWGAANTQPSFPPMGGGQWGGAVSGGMMAGPFPQQAPPTMMQPSGQPFGVSQIRPGTPSGMGMGMGATPVMNQAPQPTGTMFGAPLAPTRASNTAVNDPFGAL